MLDLTLANWWTVLVAGAVSFVPGGIWYSAVSRPWTALTGNTGEKASGTGKGSAGAYYAAGFVT